MEHSVSLSALIKASLMATVLAAVALVTVILPAEYNIDPTGAGRALGLSVLANAAEAEPLPADGKAGALGSEEIVEITVPAHKGIEYKLEMSQYDKVTYEWMTDGASLYFDLHGEPEGDTTGYFESYAIATVETMEGSFTAPFAGSHGWYWKNTSDQPVAIQLILKGQYQTIGLKP